MRCLLSCALSWLSVSLLLPAAVAPMLLPMYSSGRFYGCFKLINMGMQGESEYFRVPV